MATIPTVPAVKPAATPIPATSTLDTTDVTKLNDALGSAGVDLRVRRVCILFCSLSYLFIRPKKSPSIAASTSINRTDRMRTEVGNSLRGRTSTHGF